MNHSGLRSLSGFLMVAALVASVLALASAARQPAYGQSDSLKRQEKVSEAKYNAKTKSYFELHQAKMAKRNFRQGPNWSEARDLARSKTYKGVQGRLAIVDSVEAHDFLLRNFRFNNQGAWIGLRYPCESRKPVWVDGTVLERDDFNAWHPQWYRNPDIRCDTSGISYMGIYYLPHKTWPPFRWQASGEAKRFEYFFVEYPTGKP